MSGFLTPFRFVPTHIAKVLISASMMTGAVLPVAAQQAPPAATGAPGTSPGAAASRSDTATVGRPAGQNPRVANEEMEMIEDLAQANLAEIATGKLALEKAKDPTVLKFAQQMIDDHTKAYDDLRKVAQAKSIEIPTEPDFAHKAMSTAMMATTGDFFEKQYVQHAGVGDHRRTVDLLKKVQREAKDADLKAYAGKVLPVVQRHLTMARSLNKTQ